jgi:peptidoglycan/LPS O-acetylase OafA/YrhL
MTKSSQALDNLRGFAILMVVSFHVCIAYLAWRPEAQPPFDQPPYDWTGNPIIDQSRWFGFDLFCAFQYLYLMQLMFFLSGLFVWPSLRRRGAAQFLSERLLRLGVPFLVGVYLLMPLAYYPTFRVLTGEAGWSAFWTQWLALPLWPSGPMWFLWLLLAFDLAAAALHRFAPAVVGQLGRRAAAAGTHPGRLFAAIVAASALTYLPLGAVFKPWDWSQVGPFAIQPSFAPQYVIYFVTGLAVGAHGVERGLFGPEAMLARHWRRWLAAAPAGFALWIVPTALTYEAAGPVSPLLHLAADLGFVLAAATACFGLAATFLRFAAPMPLLGMLSAHAYGIYFIHYVFVTWLQYLLLGLAWPAVVKAAIVLTLALLMSLAATAAICRLPFGARVLGGRRHDEPVPTDASWAKAGSSE